MLYLLFLLLFSNQSFSADAISPLESQAAAQVRVSNERAIKEFKKLQDDFLKRYGAKEGVKNFQKDFETNFLKTIGEFKTYNAEKESFKPLFKAADSWVKKGDDGTPDRLKNFNDLKKEFENKFKNYEKEVNANVAKKGVSVSTPIPFDLKKAEQEEVVKKAATQEKRFAVVARRNIIEVKEKSPLLLSLICLLLIIPLSWLGWKKWH
jgi:hypothetical protein